MDIRNVVQNSFTVSTIANYQLMAVTGHTSITLADTINTFIINVSLGNNSGKYNDIPSSVFGKRNRYIILTFSMFRFSGTSY